MFKKFVSAVLVVAMVFAMAVPAFANPGQNPNQNPGGASQDHFDGLITVTVTGGGNNLVIRAINNHTGEVVIVPRAGNGTFSQTFIAFGLEVSIQVRGNSLVGQSVNLPGNPNLPDEIDRFCRYTAMVYIWNNLVTEGNTWLQRNGGQGYHHWRALLAHFQVPQSALADRYFAFDLGMQDLFDEWARRLALDLVVALGGADALEARVAEVRISNPVVFSFDNGIRVERNVA